MSITSTCSREFQFISYNTPDTVGPGSYNAPQKKIKSTRIPFGSTTRRNLWNLNDEPSDVGPGTYETMPIVRAKSALSNIGMSSERKYFIDTKKTPSPADYAPLKEWGSKRPVSQFQSRPRTTEREPPEVVEKQQVPGPGAYNLVKDPEPKATDFSVSKSPQREPARYNGIPGPGAYDVDEPESPKRSLMSPAFKSRDKRKIFNNPVNDSVMVEHKAWMPHVWEGRPFGSASIREVEWSGAGQESPGPQVHGAKITSAKKTKTDGRFGISSRGFFAGTMDQNPGPGFYESPEEPLRLCGSSMKRARSPDIWNVKHTPSPGQYDDTVAARVERAVLLRTGSPAFKDQSRRYQCLENPEPNPGPGKYYAKLPRMASGAGKIAKDQRFTEENYCGKDKIPSGPSPDAYAVETKNKKKIPGGLVPISNRFSDPKPEETKVGPGRYGKVKCDMVKPSYNVMFDPEMKKKARIRVKY